MKASLHSWRRDCRLNNAREYRFHYILAGAAAGINDTVSVTGGGQVNPANNTAQDFASTLSIAGSTTDWATVPLSSGLARTAAPLFLTDGSVMVQQYCTGVRLTATPTVVVPDSTPANAHRVGKLLGLLALAAPLAAAFIR